MAYVAVPRRVFHFQEVEEFSDYFNTVSRSTPQGFPFSGRIIQMVVILRIFSRSTPQGFPFSGSGKKQ